MQEEVLVELGLAAEEVVADAAFSLYGVDGRDFLADHLFHFLVLGTHHYVRISNYRLLGKRAATAACDAGCSKE